ncbi:TRNA (guanine-N2-)-methyltransferase [Ceratobasidium theobromae]|uniref:tRNA (guanine(26)-N(2))-dimethyltransferase n=1 Tax=Ceratobasidium theobromae TaxID=1582974 RepID=A0A5N5QUN9_9AGAM|nr:TRNA (guanine-N2-)-methyltransferase [Ceratobasidium theobromae]
MSLAAVDSTVPPGHTIHTENTARILLPTEATTFLNPIQEFNRDLSVACITTWAKRWEAAKRVRWEQAGARRDKLKKRKKDAEETGTMQVDSAPDNAGEPQANPSPRKEYIPQKFVILEALSATGLRAIRYAHEIPLVKDTHLPATPYLSHSPIVPTRNLRIPYRYVIANDISPAATEAMRRNVDLNGLGPVPPEASCPEQGDNNNIGPVKSGKRPDLGKNEAKRSGSPSALLYHHRADPHRAEVIDLDPYGTAAPFIDGAVQAVADGGEPEESPSTLDMAVLASNNYPEKCYANYGGVPVKAEYSHEVALRLVLHTLSTSASRYGRFITPLISLSIDFYVRMFVQVRSAPIEVKKAFSKSATYYVCTGCQSFHEQTIGRVVEKISEGNGSVNLTYKAQSGPPVGQECEECGFKFHFPKVAGPMWSGPIHDKSFVSEVLNHVEENPNKYGTAPRMRGMLTVASEELDTPFYFTPSRLSSFFHCNSPPLESIASALLHQEFQVSRSHACAGSLKTTATRAQVYDIIRSWIKLTPVKMENVKDGSPAKKLLSKEPTQEANFSRHPQAISRASQVKLVRYQQNPAPNWGPGSRPSAAKRKRDDGVEG